MAALTYITLDDPSAVNGTYATGINGSGQIVGYYVDASGTDQGFIYSNGTYTTLVGTETTTAVHTEAVTGVIKALPVGTTVAIIPESINNSGEIVGNIPSGLLAGAGGPAAFTYQYGTTGVFTPFALKFLGVEQSADTYAQGVNNQGQVVGYGMETSEDGFEFVGTASLSSYTGNEYLSSVSPIIDYPNSEITEAEGVNNQGEIVGNWTGTDSNVSGVVSHGFIYNNGAYLFLDDPSGVNGTFAQGVNDSDVIVGYYLDQNDLAQGFEYNQITETFTNVEVPGASETHLYGINDAGEIVGSYVDGSGNTHGFEAGIQAGPTLAVTSDSSATRGQTLSLSSLVTISDPAGVGYQTLELWDSSGTAAGGQFVVNGVAQTGGHEIDVSPANVANTVFDVGTLGGTDTLWARLLENGGTLTGWQPFTVTAPALPLPTVVVTSDSNATHGQTLALSSLVSVSDPSGVGYQMLELWDSDGTAAGGQLVVNGAAQTGGHEIDVSPANVGNTVFNAGTSEGTDTLWARLLEDNNTLTAWQEFTVTVPAPTLAVTGDSNATSGQTLTLSSLVTVSDPAGVGYQTLELWDSNGTAATGQFVVNGAAQTGVHEIDVSPANVGDTVFDVGTIGGTDTMWARLLENNGTLTGWQQLTVTAPAVQLPIVAVTSDFNATHGQSLALSSLVTVSDPGGVGYQKLELWDSDGTTIGGQFVVNGAAQTGGHEIDVSTANVGNTVFDAGTSEGTDTLWARLLQDNGTLTAWQEFTVTVPAPTLAITSDSNATSGQTLALSNLVTVSDPGGTGYQTLELWDSNGTAATGQFVVNGAAQTGAHEIDVSSANVGNTVFDVGTIGGTDMMWARLLENNGTLTSWQQFTVTAPAVALPTVAVTSDSNATRSQTLALSNLVAISDPDSVGYQTLELWDSDGTTAGGQFVVNGAAQTGGHEIDVAAANVGSTVFDAGSSEGTDTLWARLLQDNGTLTAWQEFTVTVPTPTLAITSDSNATGGQTLALSSLVTVSDPGGVGYQTLELWDSDGTTVGGQFAVNGAAQTGAHEIDVSPANVANTVFDAGTLGGTDMLWARLLENNGTLTSWQPFTVTVPNPTLSVQNDAAATPAQAINLSSLVTISDPGGVSYQKLELWDSNGTAAGGQFAVNGTAQSGGHEIDVSPADVSNTVFDEGTTGNTDTLWAQLLLNNGNATGWQKFSVAALVTVAQGTTVELSGAYAGSVNFAGSTGTLQLDSSTGFTGTVAGMAGQDTLDLTDINFASVRTPSFSGNSAGGTLSVTDGTHTANIALLGDYTASSFVPSSDSHGGTTIVDPLLGQAGLPLAPQHA